jgi:hypothetical protein
VLLDVIGLLINTMFDSLDIVHYPSFYFKQSFEHWTLSPSSGEKLSLPGPIDRTSFYLWGLEIGTSFVDWTHQSWFLIFQSQTSLRVKMSRKFIIVLLFPSQTYLLILLVCFCVRIRFLPCFIFLCVNVYTYNHITE